MKHGFDQSSVNVGQRNTLASSLSAAAAAAILCCCQLLLLLLLHFSAASILCCCCSSLLAVGAVHIHLVRLKLRMRVALIVETGEARLVRLSAPLPLPSS